MEILMDVLMKVRHGPLKERTAMALWTLAGDNYEHKKKMAEMMGMSLLFEFVNSASENLTFIGSEVITLCILDDLHMQISNRRLGLQSFHETLEVYIAKPIDGEAFDRNYLNLMIDRYLHQSTNHSQ